MTSVLSPDAVAIGHTDIPPSMVERMTLIMDAFGDSQSRLTLEQVTVATALPRSTTHRILDQLVKLNWLEHMGRDYGLGPRALGLGGRDVGHNSLRVAAFPVLHALALRTEMVVHLAVLDGTDTYYLDKFGGRAAVDVPSRVGGRAPAHCTAAGKAMLAWLSPEQIDQRFRGPLTRRTARSITDLRVLHQELGRIRSRNGLAFEQAECYVNIACVGSAIRGVPGLHAAISVVGSTRTAMDRLAPLVVNTAAAISQRLSADEPTKSVRVHDTSASARDAWLSGAFGQLVAMGDRGEWF
ncbi:IclR family transcriptional regulator [Nocardia sp. XZ_19_231]|uniref:IclR family transcriptional regulator n=1 Tax=Nocardia sp. XZ_19_231 TaxID=2769252 RepID=UPI00188EF1CC|nr:IclR family transcriptional regulator [Nocardia sp. XZ_19_231]